MVWVHTTRVVAVVMKVVPFGNRTDEKFVNHTVRKQALRLACMPTDPDCELPITSLTTVSLPDPTLVLAAYKRALEERFKDVRHEF